MSRQTDTVIPSDAVPSEKEQVAAQWGSRFGYIMVAAGAAVGLGNIWKFPYLAYENGDGAFIITFIVIAALVAYPVVKIETTIGRRGGDDAVSCFEAISPRWGFVGWIANLCTIMINMFYVVVGGWVLKYAIQYIISGDFGDDTVAYFEGFTGSTFEPIIWTFILLAFVSILLLFGITNIVERVVKVVMPCLFVFLIVCGIWAMFAIDGAAEGLSYYLIPDFSNFTFKTFAQAATQVLFSVGISWGIFTTLGTHVAKDDNIKSDSALIVACDAAVAIVAGFVVIPAAFATGTDFEAGPRLIFEVMTGAFAQLPGGRIIGIIFFVALLFAVISSLFTFFEIPMRTFEVKLKLGRRKAVIIVALIIFAGNIFVSLGFGVLNWLQLPWPDASVSGFIASYSIYDWFDCFTAYLLLPAGVVLACLFVVRAWGFMHYEKELTNDGQLKKMTMFEKVLITVVIPLFMLIVFLNVFGFIH